MSITRIHLERFTAFEQLDFVPSRGINVLVGANGTGKTHLLKVAYAACDISKTGQSFAEKLVSTFLPAGRALGRLVKRRGKSSTAELAIERDALGLALSFTNHAVEWKHPRVTERGAGAWCERPVESVFIPVKEMLANAPGFRSLHARREVHFESIYLDIIDRAFLPILRGPKDRQRRQLLVALQRAMDGKVTQKAEEFYLRNAQGELEFTLLAEGLRKLALLWLLIQNGVLVNGSAMFWDEPETNLNPKHFPVVVDILLQLSRTGVQVFLSTHDYAILKEFELAAQPTDPVSYHAFYRPAPGEDVLVESAALPFQLDHSPIAEAMTSLYDREIRRALGGEA